MPQLQDDAAPPDVSVSPARFDALFGEKPDPWDLAVKRHDRRKFAITAAALPRERNRRCFEPGCANGDLTLLLAQRCDELLAVHCAAQALDQARLKVGGHPHVRVELAILPQQAPQGRFDLVVMSIGATVIRPPSADQTVGPASLPSGSSVAANAGNWQRSQGSYTRWIGRILPWLYHRESIPIRGP